MKLGCSSLTLMNYCKVIRESAEDQSALLEPDANGFTRVMAWASGLGFSSAELWIQSENHLSTLLNEDLAPLRQAVSDLGMTTDYLTCDFAAEWFLTQSQDYLEKQFGRLALFARRMGIRTIASISPPLPATTAKRSLVYPGAPPSEVKLLPAFSWDRSWNRYVGRIRMLTEVLRRQSLNLGVEPRAREVLSNTDSILRLVDEVSVENLGGIIDTSHLRIMREIPAVSVYKLGKKLFEFQASESDGITAYHWAPGQGEVDWVETLEALGRVGFNEDILIDVVGINMEKEILDGTAYVGGLLKRLKLWSDSRQVKTARM